LPDGRLEPHGFLVGVPRAVLGVLAVGLGADLHDALAVEDDDLGDGSVLHDGVGVHADEGAAVGAEPVDFVDGPVVAAGHVAEGVALADGFDDDGGDGAGPVDELDDALVTDDPLDDQLVAVGLGLPGGQVELLGAGLQAEAGRGLQLPQEDADVGAGGLLEVLVAADGADGEADPLVGVDVGGDEGGVLVAVLLDLGGGPVVPLGNLVADLVAHAASLLLV
jgi:hypothetical protein